MYTSEGPLSGSIHILMFHDSFGLRLMQYLAEHFSNSTFVQGDLEAPNKFIDEAKPDIVIRELSERYLDSLLRASFASKPDLTIFQLSSAVCSYTRTPTHPPRPLKLSYESDPFHCNSNGTDNRCDIVMFWRCSTSPSVISQFGL